MVKTPVDTNTEDNTDRSNVASSFIGDIFNRRNSQEFNTWQEYFREIFIAFSANDLTSEWNETRLAQKASDMADAAVKQEAEALLRYPKAAKV